MLNGVNSLKLYSFCDYVPIVSNVTNLVTLIAKGIFKYQSQTSANNRSNTFKAYVIEKSCKRTVFLLLVPVISNLFFMVMDGISSLKREVPPYQHFLNNLRERHLPQISTDLIADQDFPSVKIENLTESIMQGVDARGREMFFLKLNVTAPSLLLNEYQRDIVDILYPGERGETFSGTTYLCIFQRGFQSEQWNIDCTDSNIILSHQMKSLFPSTLNMCSENDLWYLKALVNERAILTQERVRFQIVQE
ncbi:MAG: hypothetical protein Tsb0021_08680 [Chlamydiales bacterium]